MDESRGRKVGRYELVAKIGAGGMGEVYSARDPQLRRDVAVKKLPAETLGDQEWRQRLLREARSAARVNSQHVASLYDVIEEGDELFLVMELIDGEDLRQLALPLDNEEFLDVAKQSTAGLAAAHRQGVVHGDIKPENIMLTRDGEVKVLDFGVAGMVMPAGSDSATTVFDSLAVSPGSAGYTTAYAAPEVLRGRKADPRADLFSLGVVFYELLAGVHPFAAETATAVAGRAIHEEPRPLEEANRAVHPELARIVHKLLSKSPRDRFATADDLLVDLRAALTRHYTGQALAARAAWRDHLSVGVGWRGVLAALAVVGFLTAPLWSRYLPWGGDEAPAGRFDASEWVIAVLPAGYGDEQRDIRVINDGLATTLTAGLTRLSQAHELQVIPSTLLHDSGVVTAAAARQQFGVTLALTFDTQLLGDQVRVNANLIDIASQRQLAATTVDGDPEDLLRLQEQVSRQVLRMLRLELRPMEQELLNAGTQEARAYNYYVRASGYLESRVDASDLDAASELFEQALRIDDEFAAAHAGLGEALWYRYEMGRDTRLVEEAIAACDAAVRLDEMDAAGHVCRGRVLLGTGRFEDAVASFERAADLDPTRDDAYRGLADAHQSAGRDDLAEEAYREAITMRPHYWAGYRDLAIFHYRRGRYDEAIVSFEEAVQLAPDSFRGFADLGAAFYQAGRWTDARRSFLRALEINPDDSPTLSNLGTLEFYERNYDEASRLFERAAQLRPRSLAWGNLGETLLFVEGRSARAVEALQQARDLAQVELDVNPADFWSQADLAFYEALLEVDGAYERIEEALASAPDDPELLLIAARVAVLVSNTDQAARWIARSLELGATPRTIVADPYFDDLIERPELSRMLGNP